MTEKSYSPCGMECATCEAYKREQDPCSGCDTENKENVSVLRPKCKIRTCFRRIGDGRIYCVGCIKFPCKHMAGLDKHYRKQNDIGLINRLKELEVSGAPLYHADQS